MTLLLVTLSWLTLANGGIAILVSTILITIFTGIIPQAICYRHALLIGGRTIRLSYMNTYIHTHTHIHTHTYIHKYTHTHTQIHQLVYPIILLLDCLIGEEISQVHDRKYLSSYIGMTKDNALGTVELVAVTGAFALRTEKYQESWYHWIMIPLNHDTIESWYGRIVWFITLMNVLQSGYSRVPMYEGRKDNITSSQRTCRCFHTLNEEQNNNNYS